MRSANMVPKTPRWPVGVYGVSGGRPIVSFNKGNREDVDHNCTVMMSPWRCVAQRSANAWQSQPWTHLGPSRRAKRYSNRRANKTLPEPNAAHAELSRLTQAGWSEKKEMIFCLTNLSR